MSQPHVPMDPGRVHPQDPLDLAYWCEELHCTEAQLSAAVAKVGEHVAEVREHLATTAARSSAIPAGKR